jgi:alpha-beta hydrolase superfamily lysophospholipase
MTAVQRQDLSFIDPQNIVIHYHLWAVENPRGVVLISHGVGEYAARYTHVARALADGGYSVYAPDQRGHGQTGVEQWVHQPSMLGHLGPGGLRATIEDLRQLSSIIRKENPGAPLVLLGHSWGSLMVQTLVNDHSEEFDGVVLTGTAYRMPGSMNSGDLNRRHKHLGTTGHEWLSRDPEVAAAFHDDPLTFNADILALFGVRDGLRLFGRPAKDLPHKLPLLIMIGGDDPLGGEQSVTKLAEAYRTRSRLTDVELTVFPDGRHEIFNELNRDEVISHLVSWLDARYPAAAS